MMRRAKSVLFVTPVLAALMTAALSGCSSNSSNQARVEKPISMPASSQPAPSATPSPKLSPPSEAEVEAAFHRVFGNDLIAMTDGGRVSFIAGDFNGDQSEDIAILARPAVGKLDDINNEFANWIIQDADKAFIAPPGKAVVVPPREEPAKVSEGEEVLAVIHGFGARGWRNPDARQAYLVKHGAAPFLGIAPSLSQKAIRAMHLPYETDIIKQVRNNKKGFLFWTGSMYAWHPSEG
jgi:hypothetical protein